jgi:hypothetical protein
MVSERECVCVCVVWFLANRYYLHIFVDGVNGATQVILGRRCFVYKNI